MAQEIEKLIDLSLLDALFDEWMSYAYWNAQLNGTMLTVTDKWGNSVTTDLKGDKGDPFAIYRTYASISAMNADMSNVPEGKFVCIASNTEDPDNAKLYVKSASSFVFITDLSGAQGIKGDKGDTGDAAGFGTPTATVDGNVGTPSVTVTASGPDTAKVFAFSFSNMKGDKGDDLHYDEMSQEEKDDLARRVLDTLTFASDQTCKDIVDELN